MSEFLQSRKGNMSISPRPAYRIARTLAVLVACAVCSNALEPNHTLTQYGHTFWSRQEGQLPAEAYAVVQTHDGRLWIGTGSGLVSFDGARFSPWEPPHGSQLPDQTISALAPAPDGSLWIGTRRGLSHWNGAQLSERLTSPDANGQGVTSVIVDHAGSVWVGTAGFNSGGLCRVDGQQMNCYGPPDGYSGGAVQTLFEDKAGNLWIGSVGGLYQRNSGGFRRHGPGRSILAIGQDADGHIITSVSSPSGLFQLIGEQLVRYPIGKTFVDATTRVLFSDSDGGLWVGTDGEGLFHFHQGHADQFTRADGLSSDTVLGLLEDRERNVWVATNNGLDRFRDLPVTTLSKREGLSTDVVVSAFPSADGGVWLGTIQGLNRAGGGGVDGSVSWFSAGRVGTLFEDKSRTLWFSSDRGLAFAEKGVAQWLTLPGAQRTGAIPAAAQNRDGSLWFSDLNHGLIRVKDHRIANVIPWSRFDQKLAWALDVNPSNDKLLVGFAQGGAADFDGERVTRRYTTADGLGSGSITDIHFDVNGTGWLATEAGLSRLKNGKIATLTSSNGLPCSRIHAMVEDDDRNIWLNTPCGLQRISRADLNAWSSDPKFRVKPTVFGASDGMHLRPRKYGYFRGAVKSADGRLWFPESNGVAIVDPHHLPHNPMPPPVEIQSVLVDQTAHSIHPGLNLPHINQGLQIDYTALSFVDTERVRFKYKLEGYDAEWIDVGNRRQAVYPSLRPRKYVFHVIASNNDGVWNNAGALLTFDVAPTFFQTIWFQLLTAILIIGIVLGAYKLRVRQLEARLNLRFEERMKERTRISRNLHDTLLQNISGFALQLDALSKIVVTAPQLAKDELRDLRRQAETWLQEARESVWALRMPASDESTLVESIERIASRILDGKNIAFEIRTSGRRQPIDSQTKQGLIRIVQEALRNAASHSNARKIDVQLSWLAGNRLSLELRDNGEGFDLDEGSRKTGHWGLATMRERAQEIGAEFEIDTSPGHGVRIVIQIRLPRRRQTNDRKAHSRTHR